MLTYKLEPELLGEGSPQEISLDVLMAIISPSRVQNAIEDALNNGILRIQGGKYALSFHGGLIKQNEDSLPEDFDYLQEPYESKGLYSLL